MAKSKNDYTFDDIKAMLKQEKEKYDFEQTVKKVYSRPKSKLTKYVKKSKSHAPGMYECFKDENRHWSKEETDSWLKGTSYFENYEASRRQDDY